MSAPGACVEPDHSPREDLFAALLRRLVIGVFAWGLVSAVLAGWTVASALPYGGGTLTPLLSIVPWTFAVALWVVEPVARRSVAARVSCVLLVAALGAAGLLKLRWELGSGERERKREEAAFRSKFAPHRDYFSRVCEKAGVHIFREVKRVETVAFEGVRAATTREDLRDPRFRGDVYSQFDTEHDPRSLLAVALLKLYAQVEVSVAQDGRAGFARYTRSRPDGKYPLPHELVATAASSFLVRVEDISTDEDRSHWVAGSKWTVIDLGSGEVLGESTAYAIDTLQGQTSFPGGFGNAGEPWEPWRRAGHVQYDSYKVGNACPAKDVTGEQVHNLDFLRNVLFPRL
jgi:hypothetical protein